MERVKGERWRRLNKSVTLPVNAGGRQNHLALLPSSLSESVIISWSMTCLLKRKSIYFTPCVTGELFRKWRKKTAIAEIDVGTLLMF